MAVIKEDIKQALIEMTNELKTIKDTDEGIERWAEMLSTIIKDAILSADVVNVTTTSTLTVVGTSPSGAVTGTATGTSTQNNMGSLE
jgi:hypothetical protein